MNGATTVLFVYGSLKRGKRNHRHLAGQTYLGDAITEPRYHLADLGTYPGLIEGADRGLAVVGELWAVDARCLETLDAFEGVPDWYDRRPVAVAGHPGSVQAYFYARPLKPGCRTGSQWPFPVS